MSQVVAPQHSVNWAPDDVVQREWPIRYRRLALFTVLSLLRSYWIAETARHSHWFDMICVLA